MADAGVRRDDSEVVECLLAPAQELVALAVAMELELCVLLEGEPGGELVHLDRMVDDELGRAQRVDPRGVTAHLLHGVAHRREVDHRGHAGEVLHQHAGGEERKLGVMRGWRGPPSERADILLGGGS